MAEAATRPAMSPSGDPYLLTPGPLTTTVATKEAMLHDWGSRDSRFIDMNRSIQHRLVALVDGQQTHVAVLLQGSGIFAVEATLGTLIPRQAQLWCKRASKGFIKTGSALVVCNGAYGRRMVQMLKTMGRAHVVVDLDENVCPTPELVDQSLRDHPEVTHVCVVHCETTTGILNPIERGAGELAFQIAEVVHSHGRSYIVDAMSSFGALPISVKTMHADAIISSANKCLEGVPGCAFAIIKRDSLAASGGNAHSLVLDLHDQWKNFEATGQWRYTPPVQVVAAFDAALQQHAAEGGIDGRGKRYRANCTVLHDGLTALGLQTYIPAALQAPIILTFLAPRDPHYNFEQFYGEMRERGYVIYPGKLTKVLTFRLGCVGAIHPDTMQNAVQAIKATFARQGVTDFAPSSSVA